MIKNVIFDIGNVLMEFPWMRFMDELFDKEVGERITKVYWEDGRWDELDKGEDPEVVLKSLIDAAPDLEKEIRYTFENINDCMFKHSYAIPWIKDLKEKGYQVVFLSNYNQYIMDKKPEVLDFLPYLDGGVFSCDVHLVKPDKAIYDLICKKYNMDPNETIFVDDNPRNVKSANEFGIHAFLFEGYEKSYDGIMDYLSENGL